MARNESINKQVEFLKNGGIDKVHHWSLCTNVDYDTLLEAVKDRVYHKIFEDVDKFYEFLRKYKADNAYRLIEKMTNEKEKEGVEKMVEFLTVAFKPSELLKMYPDLFDIQGLAVGLAQEELVEKIQPQ